MEASSELDLAVPSCGAGKGMVLFSKWLSVGGGAPGLRRQYQRKTLLVVKFSQPPLDTSFNGLWGTGSPPESGAVANSQEVPVLQFQEPTAFFVLRQVPQVHSSSPFLPSPQIFSFHYCHPPFCFRYQAQVVSQGLCHWGVNSSRFEAFLKLDPTIVEGGCCPTLTLAKRLRSVGCCPKKWKNTDFPNCTYPLSP